MTEDLFQKKTEEGQSEFNDSFGALGRMNLLESYIESCFIEWNLRKCYSCLESYENELAFIFKGDEQKEVNKMKEEILKIFVENPQIGEKGRYGIIGFSMLGTLKVKLVELNKYLRAIKYKRGMGMALKGEGKLF